MKHSIFPVLNLSKVANSLFLGLVMVIFFSSTAVAQSGTNYQQLFWQQMGNSCQDDVLWKKAVYDLEGNTPGVPQTKEYKIECQTGKFIPMVDDGSPLPGWDEFDFLFEYEASNKFIVEYFDITEEPGHYLASIKNDSEGDTPLQVQEFKIGPDGKMRFAMSRILKDNLLYTMKITIAVWFDEQGRYARHEVETETDPVMQDGIHTRIEGKIKY